jgi:hypothetical protein
MKMLIRCKKLKMLLICFFNSLEMRRYQSVLTPKIFNLSLIQIRSYKKNKRTFILNYKKIEFFYVGVDRKCEYKYRVYFSITCSKNNEKKKTK